MGSSTGSLSDLRDGTAGGEVVSFDKDSGDRWDVVPFDDPRFDFVGKRQAALGSRQRNVNAYWLAHRLLGSRARAFHGNVYGLPDVLGSFDVVVLGMILSHLRDPFDGLASAARLSHDAVIITQQTYGSQDPTMIFLPGPETLTPDRAWWSLSEPLIERMLKVLEFELESKKRTKHACLAKGYSEMCTTYVARRTR